ncbi:MAG TPA: hypothetical protein VGR26_03015 [Acidimicrobiales bacterium]|nr:hypothetical protein [Acidimicrobiales bacterium]
MLFMVAWAAGLGAHDWRLLLATPLPLALALGYGYAGAMNAGGALDREGHVTVAESVAVIALASVLVALSIDPLAASLVALTVGRGVGALGRGLLLRSLPSSDCELSRGAITNQMWFGASTVVLALQGQADLLILGILGQFVQLAVYGPLLRTAYGTVLIAEALAWALLGRAGDSVGNNELRPSGARLSVAWLLRHWRAVGVVLGGTVAVAFVVAAAPVVQFILGRPVSGLTIPVIVFAGDIILRFLSFVQTVEIVRSGRQSERIAVGLAATAVLVLMVLTLTAFSLTGLAFARLLSEATLVLGFQRVIRRIRDRQRVPRGDSLGDERRPPGVRTSWTDETREP